jgi:hypothetical protein
MAKVVFQIISPVLKHIVMFVFYLPPCTATFTQMSHVQFTDRFVRYPAVLITRFL